MRTFFILICLLTAPFAGMAEEANSLAPQYHVGEHFLYEAQLNVDMDQKMITPEKANISYHVALASDAEVIVNQVNDDKSVDLQVKLIQPNLQFSVVNNDGNNNQFNLSFDSTNEDEPAFPPFQFIYPIAKCLDGVQFTVNIDPNGRISGIQGLDAVREKVEKELAVSVPDGMRDQICTAIKSKFLLSAVTHFTSYLPDHPVKVGDQWKGSSTDHGFGDDALWTLSTADQNQLKMEKKYTVDGERFKGLIDSGLIKDMKMDATESLNITKGSHVILSVNENATMSSQQKMALPDGRDLDAQYNVTAQFSLQKK